MLPINDAVSPIAAQRQVLRAHRKALHALTLLERYGDDNSVWCYRQASKQYCAARRIARNAATRR